MGNVGSAVRRRVWRFKMNHLDCGNGTKVRWYHLRLARRLR